MSTRPDVRGEPRPSSFRSNCAELRNTKRTKDESEIKREQEDAETEGGRAESRLIRAWKAQQATNSWHPSKSKETCVQNASRETQHAGKKGHEQV